MTSKKNPTTLPWILFAASSLLFVAGATVAWGIDGFLGIGGLALLIMACVRAVQVSA